MNQPLWLGVNELVSQAARGAQEKLGQTLIGSGARLPGTHLSVWVEVQRKGYVVASSSEADIGQSDCMLTID